MRNPWRFSFDPATGDLWIADVGDATAGEIDWLPAPDSGGAGRGANLGWSIYEGRDRYERNIEHYEDAVIPPEGYVAPVFTSEDDDIRDESESGVEKCALIGGVVYRGERIPELVGWYVFSDYCDSRVSALRLDGGALSEYVSLAVDTGPIEQIVAWTVDDRGELLAVGSGGIARLEPVD